jgi:hypothetical protein
MVMPGSNERRLGAASSITESPMAVTPAGRTMAAEAVGSGRVDTAAGGRRGTGVGVGLSAGTGGGGVGLRDGASTIGAASGADIDGEGDGGLGDGACVAVREAVHPAAASRMDRPAVATRFLNAGPLR